MSMMEILDNTGHTKHIWEPDDEAGVEAARQLFNTLTGKGHRAFRVKKDGGQGTRMDTFDPEAEAMLLVPHLRGG